MLDEQTTKDRNESTFLTDFFDISLALTILLFFSGEMFAYDTYDSKTEKLSIELIQVS